MAGTNSGKLIGRPTENDVSLLPFKSALNVNIVASQRRIHYA